MNARYVLLLQRQFDEPLSERESYELQGFLAGNESAAKLRENVDKVINEFEHIELPEHLQPEDAHALLLEICSKLETKKSNSWLSGIKNFIDCRTSKAKVPPRSDELALIRSKRKQPTDAPAVPQSNILRAKQTADSTQLAPQTALSLAEAIKQKLLNKQVYPGPSLQPPTFNNTPLPINLSIDRVFETEKQWPTHDADTWKTPQFSNSSEDWVVPPPRPVWEFLPPDPVPPETINNPNPVPREIVDHQDPVPPIINQPNPARPENIKPPTPQHPLMPIETQTQLPQNFMSTDPPQKQPESIKPSTAIPVDDIIAHIGQIFAERVPISPLENDPLGAASGVYPQIREEDLRKAKAARLSTSGDTTEQRGQIKSIGKFLLDKNSETAIGAIGNAHAHLANARVLTNEEARALQECLSPIESQQGVAGCVIVGYDGIVITSTLPEHIDKDAYSAWALLTYINCHELVKVVGHSRLRQVVSRTGEGYLLLADFGQGLLVAVSDNAATEAIIPLMKSVRRVTAA